MVIPLPSHAQLCLLLQCEDDPSWSGLFTRPDGSTYQLGGCSPSTSPPNKASLAASEDVGCEEFMGQPVADVRGVLATEACPVTCRTGCFLTYDSCWNRPCLNGGVCTDMPGIEEFQCELACPTRVAPPLAVSDPN